MAFCIKNFKYKKTDSYLTMKLQKAFTANNAKNNLAFRAHESASARASSLFTSLSCTINLKLPVIFHITLDVIWNLIGSDSRSSFLGQFLNFVIAVTCSTNETSRSSDNEVKQCTISSNFSIYCPCIDNR